MLRFGSNLFFGPFNLADDENIPECQHSTERNFFKIFKTTNFQEILVIYSSKCGAEKSRGQKFSGTNIKFVPVIGDVPANVDNEGIDNITIHFLGNFHCY